MPTTCTAVYIVSGHDFKLVASGPTQTLATFQSNQTYVRILYNNVPYVLDLSLLMLRTPLLDNTQSVEIFLENTVSDQIIAGYVTNDLPDFGTARYEKRIDVYDGQADADTSVSYTSLDYPTVMNDVYRKNLMDDLAITSTTRTLANTLVAVNGVLHRSVIWNNALYVADGFKNMKNCKHANVTCLDTTGLGGHQIIPIQNNMILSPDTTDPWNGVYLQIDPAVDLTKCTVMVSIAGYLQPLNETYRLVGNNILKIDTNKIDMLNNYLRDPNTRWKKAPDVGSWQDPYLQSISPLPKPTPVVIDDPTVQQNISAFMSTLFQQISQTGASTGLTESTVLAGFEFADDFSVYNVDDSSIPASVANTLAFGWSQILHPRSFLILVNTPHLKKRVFPLEPIGNAHMYQTFSLDTPRGILLYDNKFVVPYTMTSAEDLQRVIYLPDPNHYTDLYQTTINPECYPNPAFGGKDRCIVKSATLYDLYSS